MDEKKNNFCKALIGYKEKFVTTINSVPEDQIFALAEKLLDVWEIKSNVYIFGNGGSAANAIHIANDLIYGISKEFGNAISISALSSNSAVITCLANDVGYEDIYSHQLAVLARPGDLVIALSGSGNSLNIINAIHYCKSKSITTAGIFGYTGGKALDLVDLPVHIAVEDMQISEDMQLVIFHMIMQWLFLQKK